MGSGSAEGSGAALPPALLPQGGGAPEQAWEAQAVATSGSLTRGGTMANFARARALADAAVANAEGRRKGNQVQEATEAAADYMTKGERRPTFKDARPEAAEEPLPIGGVPAPRAGAMKGRQRAVTIGTTTKDAVQELGPFAGEEEKAIMNALAGESSYTHHGVHCCIINPSKRFRHTWDILMVAILFYVSLAVPYRIGFSVDIEIYSPLWFMEVLIELLFIVDIVLNFVTGIPFQYGYIEMRPDRIRQIYFWGWFPVDLMACLPLRFMEVFISGDKGTLEQAKALKILRLLRITRLLQLGKLRHVFTTHAEWFDKVARFGKLGGLMTLMIYCCHVFGCMWYFFGTFGEVGGVAVDGGWIEARGLTNTTSNQERYITSFYWAIVSLSTVGFGDITAQTPVEMVFSSITVIIGTVFFGIMVSLLGTVATNKSVLEDKIVRRLDELQAFLQQKNLPKEVRHRVRMFLEIAYQEEAFDSTEMLNKLP